MTIATTRRNTARPAKTRIGRYLHGYSEETCNSRGMLAPKPAFSPQAIVIAGSSFGRCRTCKRDYQELFNNRCFDCRAFGLGE